MGMYDDSLESVITFINSDFCGNSMDVKFLDVIVNMAVTLAIAPLIASGVMEGGHRFTMRAVPGIKQNYMIALTDPSVYIRVYINEHMPIIAIPPISIEPTGPDPSKYLSFLSLLLSENILCFLLEVRRGAGREGRAGRAAGGGRPLERPGTI